MPKIIHIMNSGDYFASNDVFSKAMPAIKENPDVIHGLDQKKTWPLLKLFYIVRYGPHMRLRKLMPDKLADKLIMLRKKKAFESDAAD